MKAIPKASKRAVEARSQGICEAGLKGCKFIGDQIHHKKPRSAQGSMDPINLMKVCWWCHHLITLKRPGTAKFRTLRNQPEGDRADQAPWLPPSEQLTKDSE